MGKKVVFILFLLLFHIPNVLAVTCDKEYIEQLKVRTNDIIADTNFVGNINLDGNYQWYEVSFNLDAFGDEVFVSTFKKEERANNSSDKLLVESGTKEFGVYSSYCGEYRVNTVKVDLPKFNEYSLSSSCIFFGDEEVEECDSWYQGKVSKESLKEAVDHYYESHSEDKGNFFTDHYVAFIIGGVVILVVIGFVIFRRIQAGRLD